jgi:DNA modification methylase
MPNLSSIETNLTNMAEQKLSLCSPDTLTPYPTNARLHGERQITALMAAIREFGFRGAIIINKDNVVLSGHGRLEAAKRLKLKEVPVIIAENLTPSQERAYVLADNKLAQLSEWDDDLLKMEMNMLIEDDFNIEVTGFSTAEVDFMFDKPVIETSSKKAEQQQAADNAELPEDLIIIEQATSRLGDLWILGKHKLYCGDATERNSYAALMGDEKAELVVTDPPYNVKIDGHVCGSGEVKHEEFAMASGEMSSEEFTEFLKISFTHSSVFMSSGAFFFSFMDWRHMKEIQAAAQPIFGGLKQLCVWVKNNGGMGSFYRSQHELVFIFKNGQGKHINNFELGQNGRYRTNVWEYAGVNSFGKNQGLLTLHPTVKPAGMIADALRDCSNRNGIVLDPFAGSGTIIIAAEQTGRCARAIEYEPKYVDVAIRRWERITGQEAVLAATGQTYDEVENLRAEEVYNG